MGIQVTELTLGKDCHEKEFIDFEFDGKHVSEFGMVAVADGGRHSFDAAPTFEDETSQVNGVDGQYYWGTHFGSKKMSFVLATDGMTEAQINAFKRHFQPGKYGKFIEDKLACRQNYARVAQITTFNTVPFKIQKKIKEKTIYINEYKGDCRITFEFDNPYFETNLHLVKDLEDQKELRALYINGTPHKSSWKKSTPCFIGDSEYILKQGAALLLNDTVVAGSNILYYNPSTAKTKSVIELNFTPTFSSTNFPIYFKNIYDDINCEDSTESPFNQISITDSLQENTNLSNLTSSDYISSFRYTSPNVIYSINKAINIAHTFYSNDFTLLNDLEKQLRLEITNPKVMGWAASILRIIATKNGTFYDKDSGNFLTGTLSVNCTYINEALGQKTLTWFEYFNIFMLYMLAHHGVNVPEGTLTQEQKSKLYHIENSLVTWNFPNYTIRFDGIKNQTYMTYTYNQIIEAIKEISVEEESCGDMVLSEYLILDGGDTLLEEDAINTYHSMKFIQGSGTSHSVDQIKLFYTPTYF